jgi:hypothetical protein
MMPVSIKANNHSIIDTALALGTPKPDAMAAIQYLAEKFGMITIPIPKSSGKMEELSKELLKTISEFGDVTREVSAAMQDNAIRPNEARRIESEAWDLIRQVSVFIQAVNSASEKQNSWRK